ncbi:MAG: hypothetical protein JWM59_4673 [Verrucomicrobiales bacterium]|nr:hypothetical protein [Verrucomicrobiales bacterium]
MKRLLRFLWRLTRRSLWLAVVSLLAIAAGYWTGRHSVGGSTADALVSTAPGPLPPSFLSTAPPKALSLKHRLALLLESDAGMGPRTTVELYGLSAAELKEVMKIAEGWPGGTRGILYGRASAALAFLEPEPVVAGLLSQRADLGRNIRIAEVMAMWAKRDPMGAFHKWEKDLALDKFGGNGLENIIPELGKKDLPLAFAKLRELEERDRERREQHGISTALFNLCEVMNRTPQTREAVIRELLKPENADPALLWAGLPVLFRNVDYSNPAALGEMMAWMDGSGASPDAKAAILSGVLDSRMHREDPAAVAEWYLVKAEEVGQPVHRSLDEVTRSWVERDLNACGEWLNRQEPTPDLDAAIHSFSQAAASSDADAAFAWAARITDDRARINGLCMIWHKTRRLHSRQEVREILDSSPITPADREALKSKLPP